VTAIELIQAAAQVIWVAIGAIEVARAIRRPTRANVDIALFFGVLAYVAVQGRLLAWIDVPFEGLLRSAALYLVMSLPYLLLRITRDFVRVPAPIMRASELGLLVSFGILLVFGTGLLAATLYLVLYFAAVVIYCAARMVQLATTSYGVTRQRMRAAAIGSYLLGMAILLAGIGLAAPGITVVTAALTQICAVGSAIAYAVGFTPPNALKRFWQIPEFRGFVRRSSVLPRTSLEEIAAEVAEAAGRALGAHGAIGLWDERAGVLRFRAPPRGLPEEIGPSEFVAWRVFASQRPEYVPDAAARRPRYAETYRSAGVGPILAAPITAGDRRLGVLAVYAAREPIFAEDDLAFVELMAGQAAVLLESRRLIDDAARVRAVEEAARMKEDFVSAAAHDLKTPLTTIVAQAQLIERRAEREGRTAELAGIQRLVREASQLTRLVEELLDASRLERGALPMHREPADLAEIAREAVQHERQGAERIEFVADGAVRGSFDPERVRQLIDNLVENALKYSPAAGPVTVRVWSEAPMGRVAVTDQGIGIPPEDLPHLFERFRRGSNVDHRRFSGIGLGLYICRGIAEQHGGRVWVESATGRGTTFHVALPLGTPEQADASGIIVTS
jgi:signal transduction histidine kinase